MGSETSALEAVLPHAHPMILIDEVSRTGESSVCSKVRIGEDSLFYEEPNGVPAFVGIEYIAQTVAAHAGMVAVAQGEPVRVGLLLGTRQYTCAAPYFPLGALLTISVDAVYEAPRISKFVGAICDAAMVEVGRCALTVYLRDGTETGP